MGVKTMIELSREEAEARYVDMSNDGKRRQRRARAARLSNADLEEALADMNDEAKDGEGFESYRIAGPAW